MWWVILVWFGVILKQNMNLIEKIDWYKKISDLSKKCEISKISAKFRWKKKNPARGRGGPSSRNLMLYATPTSSSCSGIEGFSPSGYLAQLDHSRSTVRSHSYDTQLAPTPDTDRSRRDFPLGLKLFLDRSIIRLFFIILRPPIRSDPRMHLLFTLSLSRFHSAPPIPF